MWRGKGFFGGRVDKYFTTTGQSITLEQFNELIQRKKKY